MKLVLTTIASVVIESLFGKLNPNTTYFKKILSDRKVNSHHFFKGKEIVLTLSLRAFQELLDAIRKLDGNKAKVKNQTYYQVTKEYISFGNSLSALPG